jgi:hypothetical protein
VIRDDVLLYLDINCKLTSDDPLHKWKEVIIQNISYYVSSNGYTTLLLLYQYSHHTWLNSFGVATIAISLR